LLFSARAPPSTANRALWAEATPETDWMMLRPNSSLTAFEASRVTVPGAVAARAST